MSPGARPTALLIGDVNLARCEPTAQALPLTTPSGPGYCSQLARATTNPGYDVNAVPAPPLKQVIAQAGAGC